VSVYTEPAAWEADLSALLSALGYHPTARAEVVAHVNANGYAEGCETIEDPEDVARVNAVLEGHWNRDADVADWPEWTLDRYEPTAEDWSWLETELDRDAALDEMAARESATLGRTEPDDGDDLAVGWVGGHPA
jgi:hypothetical protein